MCHCLECQRRTGAVISNQARFRREQVIFAGFTMFDFQRIRTSTDINSAPFLAASIFLDILNVFLFFLQIFSGGRD